MTINQAFIKAYRQDDAPAVRRQPSRSATTDSAAILPGTSIEYVSLSGPQLAASYAHPAPVSHGAASGPASTTDWPACDAPFGRIDPAAGGKRPLSAFTAGHRTARAQHAVPGDVRTAFTPATTVASFAWPEVCRTLCRRFGDELDRAADRLLHEARGGRTLMGMIGLFPGSGTTTALMCIAARLAARHGRAIVVEGNFLAPCLAERLDARPTAWWQDVGRHAADLADAVVRAEDDNLDLLPLGVQSPDAPRAAASPHIAATASILRSAYDLVLVDLGAFFDPDSQPVALELVRNMQINLVAAVAGPEPPDPRDLATLADYLEQAAHCELLGVVENRIARP